MDDALVVQPRDPEEVTLSIHRGRPPLKHYPTRTRPVSRQPFQPGSVASPVGDREG